ncbi:MAG: protein kinase [Myxococcota bacterium]|nr:protein kinase [Myxococcota bacterium]
MAGHEPEVGDVVGQKYVIEALLGRGGMGAVFRASHQITGRRVALKWLLEDDAERRERFLREARAMGRLAHPNVVGVLDVGEHEGAIFLVMEHLDGKPLRDFVREGGVPAAEAVGLVMPALMGVAAAHQAGILHRDLKPENLFVCCDRDGTPFDTKVLDFGVAKRVKDDVGLTRSGTIVGTPKYMAPEQIGEEDDVDQRADVYALGLIVFELSAGKMPYRATSLNALLLEIMTSELPPLGDVLPDAPPGYVEVLERALAKAPADRFEDVASFARALEPFGEARFEPPRRVHTPETGAVARPAPVDPDSDTRLAPSTPPSGERPTVPEKPSEKPAALVATRSERPSARSSDGRSERETESDAAVPAPPRSRRGLIGGLAAVALLGVASLGWAAVQEPEPEPPAPVVEAPPTVEAPPVLEEADEAPEPGMTAAEAPVEAPVEEEAEAEPEEAAPAAVARVRRSRRPARPAARPAEPESPPEAEPSLTVSGRAGTLRADDF